MLGFSVGKLLVLALLLFVLWQGVKFVTRAGQIRQAVRRAAERAATQANGSRARTIPAEDLVKCVSCAAFVPANGATSCGRADCPWGR
jgi:hypothetical protein